jgi:hypothetical protein
MKKENNLLFKKTTLPLQEIEQPANVVLKKPENLII